MKTKCTRCGRAIKQVYMHAGRPFGSTCVKMYAQDSGVVLRVRDAMEYTGQTDWIEDNQELWGEAAGRVQGGTK